MTLTIQWFIMLGTWNFKLDVLFVQATLVFPEALEEAQLEELDAIIKPIEQFFTEAGMSICPQLVVSAWFVDASMYRDQCST